MYGDESILFSLLLWMFVSGSFGFRFFFLRFLWLLFYKHDACAQACFCMYSFERRISFVIGGKEATKDENHVELIQQSKRAKTQRLRWLCSDRELTISESSDRKRELYACVDSTYSYCYGLWFSLRGAGNFYFIFNAMMKMFKAIFFFFFLVWKCAAAFRRDMS